MSNFETNVDDFNNENEAIKRLKQKLIVDGVIEMTQRLVDGYITKDEHSDMIVNLLYQQGVIK